MKYGIVTIAFSMIVLCQSPASANISQNANDQTSIQNEIVVIGEKERKKRINSFIKSTIKISRDEQYARYKAAACPVVIGFKADKGQFIEQRIRQVVEASGAEVAPLDCEPNIVVAATEDPGDVIAYLRKKHSHVFGGMYIPQRNRLMKGPGPAYAWNITRTRFNEGTTPVSVELIDNEGIQTSSGTGSRIKPATNQDIDIAVLMIRTSGLMTVNPRQLADYAVMRLLANADEPKKLEHSEQSILSLFAATKEGLDAPESVTAWDLALLRALYMSPSNLNAQQMRSHMTKVFEEELVKIAEQDQGGS